MDIQILPLVLILTGCLVGIRSVAARSLAVSLSGERGCTGDPIAARTPGGAVNGEMERSADNGIRFVRPPQLRRRGLQATWSALSGHAWWRRSPLPGASISRTDTAVLCIC
jgi:hypothetical protein